MNTQFKNLEGVKKYQQMQFKAYNHPDKNAKWHADSLVSASWYPEAYDPQVGGRSDYQLLFNNEDNSHKRALDFGCGIGRMIVNFKDDFTQIDGVDISASMIESAKEYTQKAGITNSQFYVCSGYDLECILSDTYDIIYSSLVFEHIAVHEIRYNYLKEFFRILKPSGEIHILFKGGIHYDKVKGSPSVEWYTNYYDAPATNSACDSRVDNPIYLVEDLYSIGFRNIQIQFTAIPTEGKFKDAAGHQWALMTIATKVQMEN